MVSLNPIHDEQLVVVQLENSTPAVQQVATFLLCDGKQQILADAINRSTNGRVQPRL